MNNSETKFQYLTKCTVTDLYYAIIANLPKGRQGRNRIAVLVVNCILLFTTISLNGISVITIRKSAQLRSKVCYFVVLLQSLVDLGVGVLTIPSFLYYLIFPYLDIANCTVMVVILRSSHLPCKLSIVTLSAMTMERYIGVLYPYHYKSKVTKNRILIYVCSSYSFLLVTTASSFYDRKIDRLIFAVMITGFFLFTGFVYTKIYLVIRKIASGELQRKPADENDRNQGGMKKKIMRESRQARSCFLVVICFAVFLIPLTLTPVFFSFGTIDVFLYLTGHSHL